MGFFDFVTNVAQGMLDIAEKRASGGHSVIPSGRMKETDQIKGKNSSIPNTPGIYRHRDKETHGVEYVGQTDDLRTRTQQHARDGKLDTNKQYVQYTEAKSGSSKEIYAKLKLTISHVISLQAIRLKVEMVVDD